MHPSKTLEELLLDHCRPLVTVMTDEAIVHQLAVLPKWSVQDQSIARTYRFGNYYETLAFINAIAYIVHREDHHPELTVGYNRCSVRFDTHSVGGISLNDFICAAKCDAVFGGPSVETTPESA